jgi:hypothetical protein
MVGASSIHLTSLGASAALATADVSTRITPVAVKMRRNVRAKK